MFPPITLLRFNWNFLHWFYQLGLSFSFRSNGANFLVDHFNSMWTIVVTNPEYQTVNVKQTPKPQWTTLMEQLVLPIVLVLWCEHMVGNGRGSPGPDRREEEGNSGDPTGGAGGNLPRMSGDSQPPIYLPCALCNGHLIEVYGMLIHLHATNGVKMLRGLGPIHSLNLIYTDFNVIRFCEV